MKRLVLLGEGHGEVSGLPILMEKILQNKEIDRQFFLDKEVIRAHNADGLVKWDKKQNQNNYSEWLKFLRYATSRKYLSGVLAVFDGDSKNFPAGANTPFCPVTAAKAMAIAARETGAGKMFSLAIVFACVEYETWLIAGIGQDPSIGKSAHFPGAIFPPGDPESHGKSWIIKNVASYRPTRDQKTLTESLNIDVVRAKKLRSFTRLENAIDQLTTAINSGKHICSPP